MNAAEVTTENCKSKRDGETQETVDNEVMCPFPTL